MIKAQRPRPNENGLLGALLARCMHSGRARLVALCALGLWAVLSWTIAHASWTRAPIDVQNPPTPRAPPPPFDWRTGAFARLHGPAPPPPVGAHDVDLVLTSVNEGALDLAINWAMGLRAVSPFLADRVVVVCEDERSSKRLAEVLGARHTRRSPTAAHGNGSAYDFNTNGYHYLMSLRYRYILEELRKGRNVLFSDVDVAFVRDPLPHLRHRLATTSIDISTQDDGDFACMGFVLYRAGRPAELFLEALLETVPQWVDDKTNDQQQASLLLTSDAFTKRTGLTFYILDLTIFASGWAVWGESKTTPETLWWDANKNAVATVHNNFIVGVDAKVARFRASGWFRLDTEWTVTLLASGPLEPIVECLESLAAAKGEIAALHLRVLLPPSALTEAALRNWNWPHGLVDVIRIDAAAASAAAASWNSSWKIGWVDKRATPTPSLFIRRPVALPACTFESLEAKRTAAEPADEHNCEEYDVVATPKSDDLGSLKCLIVSPETTCAR